MRILLAHFTIPGEAQIVDRIIDSFSKEYFNQNSEQSVFKHSDGVFSFSYLLMMLQTNLHNPQVI
jgi:Sec7-like guanine-nucleotide exchange factor